MQRDPGAGDRGGSRSAIGLQNIAVECDLALAERLKIGNRAQAAADQALDLVRAAGLLAGIDFRRVRVWVARGSMPYSAVIQPRPWPRSQAGGLSSSEAVHSTWVAPNFTRHEPSA